MNLPGKIKLGTVGQVTPGMELKLAEDGEVLIRGPQIMKGYRNMPEKTAEAIDAEGWLHTGDIGELDDEGYLKIVDRKKELIINAAGKNISPANLEAKLKAHPLIGTACVIGDQRPYLTALIVLDPDVAPAWAASRASRTRRLDELADDERLRAEIQRAVDDVNARSRRSRASRSSPCSREDWLPGGDELTPTMKLKRKPIAAEVRLADRGDVREIGRADFASRRRGCARALAFLRAIDQRASSRVEQLPFGTRLPAAGAPAGVEPQLRLGRRPSGAEST